MTTSAYLSLACRLEHMIANKKLEIEHLESKATNMVASYDKDNVKTSGSYDKMANIAIDVAEESKKVDVMRNKRQLIITQIDEIGDLNSYEILTMYYVLNADLQEIADTLGYSLSHTKRLKAKALKRFEDAYFDTYKNLKVQFY